MRSGRWRVGEQDVERAAVAAPVPQQAWGESPGHAGELAFTVLVRTVPVTDAAFQAGDDQAVLVDDASVGVYAAARVPALLSSATAPRAS